MNLPLLPAFQRHYWELSCQQLLHPLACQLRFYITTSKHIMFSVLKKGKGWNREQQNLTTLNKPWHFPSTDVDTNLRTISNQHKGPGLTVCAIREQQWAHAPHKCYQNPLKKSLQSSEPLGKTDKVTETKHTFKICIFNWHFLCCISIHFKVMQLCCKFRSWNRPTCPHSA